MRTASAASLVGKDDQEKFLVTIAIGQRH